MKAVFYNKDFSQTLKPPIKVEVERYSWNMIGGPREAHLKSDTSADKWEMMKLLRAPVEIYGDDGECVWWGFVNRVTVPIGGRQRLGLGLNEMFNHITVTYEDGDTTAGSDTNSISEYGQKEKRLNDTILDSTNADNKRDIYLLDHKYAKPEIEFSGGQNEINIECYGWNDTLGWKYYSTTSVTNTAHETQINTIVTDSEFVLGTRIPDASGLTSSKFRDGNKTAGSYVTELLRAGTDNTQPYLSYVDKNRWLNVYERTAQPAEPEFLLLEDGRLESPLGQVEKEQKCRVGAWIKPQGIPETIGGFSAMGMFFIESAEYNVSRDKTTYKAAGAFEQIRLSKYVSSIISGDGGGNFESSETVSYYSFGKAVESFIELKGQALSFVSPSYTILWDQKTYGDGQAFEWPHVNDANVELRKRGYYLVSCQILVEDLTEGDLVKVDFHPFIKNQEKPQAYADSSGDATVAFGGIFYKQNNIHSFITVDATATATIGFAYMQMAYLGPVDMGASA